MACAPAAPIRFFPKSLAGITGFGRVGHYNALRPEDTRSKVREGANLCRGRNLVCSSNILVTASGHDFVVNVRPPMRPPQQCSRDGTKTLAFTGMAPGQPEPFKLERLSVSRFGQVPCVEPQKTCALCVRVARKRLARITKRLIFQVEKFHQNWNPSCKPVRQLRRSAFFRSASPGYDFKRIGVKMVLVCGTI